jgi:hypothetical protein
MLVSEAQQMTPRMRAIIRNPLALPKTRSMMPARQRKDAFFFLVPGNAVSSKWIISELQVSGNRMWC